MGERGVGRMRGDGRGKKKSRNHDQARFMSGIQGWFNI